LIPLSRLRFTAGAYASANGGSRLLKRYKAAVKAPRIRDVRFHDLRHTFGTRMAAAWRPDATLQEWMGHREYKTTLI
jgi:integrase